MHYRFMTPGEARWTNTRTSGGSGLDLVINDLEAGHVESFTILKGDKPVAVIIAPEVLADLRAKAGVEEVSV